MLYNVNIFFYNLNKDFALKVYAMLTSIILVSSLSSCGGGGGGSSSNSTPAVEVPNTPAAEAPIESASSKVIHDGFSIENHSNGAFTQASVSTYEPVSYFAVTERTQVQKIEWLGLAAGLSFVNEFEETVVTSETATFVVRVYEGEEWPNSYHLVELVEQASLSVVRTHNGKNVYHFVLEADELMTLDEGHYWLSVLDPESEMIDFSWEWEPFVNSYRGLGGAGRTLSPAGEWIASEDEPRSDEGNMLRITGLVGI